MAKNQASPADGFSLTLMLDLQFWVLSPSKKRDSRENSEELLAPVTLIALSKALLGDLKGWGLSSRSVCKSDVTRDPFRSRKGAREKQ